MKTYKDIYQLPLRAEDAFVYGYNQALQDNVDKKYTKYDLEHLLFITWRYFVNNPKQIDLWIKEDTGDFLRNYIKDYLQPKTQWDIEVLENNKIITK